MLLERTYNIFSLGNEGFALTIPKIISTLLNIEAGTKFFVFFNEKDKEIRYYLHAVPSSPLPAGWTLISQVTAFRTGAKGNIVRLIISIPVVVARKLTLKAKQKVQLELNAEEKFFTLHPQL